MWSAARAALAAALWFVGVLLGAVVLVQLLLWAAPGDPIDLLPNGAELRPQLEVEWGLDQPLPVRIGRYVVDAAQGQLGQSLAVRPGAAVGPLVTTAAARSLSLLVPALLLSVLLAVVLAVGTRGRHPVVRGAVQLLTVVPVFLMAYLAVVGINELTWTLMQAGRIARPEWFALPDQDTPARTALAVVVLAMGSGTLGELHASVETELTTLLRSLPVTATRARGGSVLPVVLRQLAPGLLAIAGRRLPLLVGGLVVVEKVLLLNGAGALLWDACLKRDHPLAMGLALAAAFLVAATRLVVDLGRIWLDPRLRRLS